MKNYEEIILRERLPDSNGEANGWIIILAGSGREREILAVLCAPVGLDYARHFARMLANKFSVANGVKEEITTEAGGRFIPPETGYSPKYA